ncbi:acyltransferase domain-containing protein [Paenibacillus sp. SYP-B3998]|uniref:Acyltransferase domain-containing protein n=1 Tax=Paenibacillus sp. SYP-B3998 TaxID=2678564 RepID=A0A6G3ZR78_9BACL|nr:acyltransferase domain-containing protein [Paenibacillus sp. SYP-B3998]NEW04625.1 acyltransferase domain-containing protein [Paenibacillus sp. SYP-B3998]
MGNPVVFMFSGQGSQYWNMGKELYNQDPVFRKWMLELDDLVQPMIGKSVLAHLYNPQKGRNEIFDQLTYSHPAVFMVEYALAQSLKASGITPDLVIGSSLGEFTSATVAGVLDVESSLESITEQARIIQTYCERGSMLAILHNVSLYEETETLNKFSELASVNFDSHFVVSGGSEPIKEIQSMLKAKGILCQALPVSYAFHSTWIDPAEDVYKNILQTQSFRTPQITMVSSVNGQVESHIQREYFWEVVRKPIQFTMGIQQVEKLDCPVYVDLSPSSTLANFAKRNIDRSELKCLPILTPFHQDLKNMEMVKGMLRNWQKCPENL